MMSASTIIVTSMAAASSTNSSSNNTEAAFALHQSPGPGTLNRTLSEGELSSYSSVTSIRDTIISAYRTRESIRKSRASLQALREESRQTLAEANDLRREMRLLLHYGHSTPKTISTTTAYESDLESDSGVLSHPSTVDSEVSDLTLDC